jgi:cyclase
LVKTTKFKNSRYVGDPINVVKIFNDKEVDELIILDISAARERSDPDFDYIVKVVSECFMPVCYGGGIKSIEDARVLFSLGIEKIAINSAAVENPILVRELSEIFGSQSIVISIDVKEKMLGGYEVYTFGGQSRTRLNVRKHANRMEEMGAGEILINSIDRDGTMMGYDIGLIKDIATSVRIPVVACGGAGKIDDFRKAIGQGQASAVSAGSLFVFHGRHKAVLVSYPERKTIKKLLART